MNGESNKTMEKSIFIRADKAEEIGFIPYSIIETEKILTALIDVQEQERKKNRPGNI